MHSQRNFVTSGEVLIPSYAVRGTGTTNGYNQYFGTSRWNGRPYFQGNYGTPRGGSATRVPAHQAASIAWYRDTLLAQQMRHLI